MLTNTDIRPVTPLGDSSQGKPEGESARFDYRDVRECPAVTSSNSVTVDSQRVEPGQASTHHSTSLPGAKENEVVLRRQFSSLSIPEAPLVGAESTFEQPKEEKSATATNIGSHNPATANETTRAVDLQTSVPTMTVEKRDCSSVPASTLNHQECNKLHTWPSHTDACWNDPHWNARNHEVREKLEARIRSGCYQNTPWWQFAAMFHDQKYKLEVTSYSHRELNQIGYSNIQVTKSEDNKVLVNINRNFVSTPVTCFEWKGNRCILTGYSPEAPVVVNLDAEKIYEQRCDHYCPFELNWYCVRASPDGNTFLVRGSLTCGWPPEYRFYDSSKPDQGFRLLPSGFIMAIPDSMYSVELPEWYSDRDGRTTVTLTVTKDYDEDNCVDENGYPIVFKTTMRREKDRMVEVACEAIPTERTSPSDSN